MKKISVKEFIDIYDNSDSFNFVNYLREKYVPVEEKITIIEKLVETKNSRVKEDDEIFNYVAGYVSEKLLIIDMFTCIDIDFGNATEEYNLLQERNIFKSFCNYINPDELDEFKTLLSLSEKDYYNNNYMVQSFIMKQLDKVLEVGKPFLDAIYEDLKKHGLEDLLNANNNEE